MKRKLNLPEQEIIYKYQVEDKTTTTIAEEYGCSASSIWKILLRNDIPITSDTKKRLKLPEREIISEYTNEHKSLSSIAKKHKCGDSTIRRVLRRNGIARRPRDEHFKKRIIIDKTFLIQEYKINKRSCKQIANDIGCHEHTVNRALRDYGIPISKGDRESYNSPETLKQRSDALRDKDHPIHSAKSRMKMIEALHSDATQMKKSKNMLGDHNPMWRGGISFEPYCPKFNSEFKDRVRKFFDSRCLICGIPEEDNGQRMQVHHVNYNKTACCDDSIPMFAPLCKKCHPKTNHNRERWQYMLAYIIQTQYGGMSFVPR